MQQGLAIWAMLLLYSICHAGQEQTPPTNVGALAPQLERHAITLRGLERRQKIHWAIVSRQQFQAYVRSIFEQQYTPGEIQREGDAYKALGLISPTLDYERLILTLLEEQTGGYYDPQKDTFYLVDRGNPNLQTDVIVHELTHALQDQHFRIDDFVSRIRGNSDAMLARAALAEGEATWVSMAYTSGADDLEHYAPSLESDDSSSQEAADEVHAPHFLQALLMFPYTHGLKFVNYGRQTGGWQRLNQAYADLPMSTEQILHPERYFDTRDNPVAIRLAVDDAMKEQGWEPIFEDVLGEFVLRYLLAMQGNLTNAIRAAAGWNGDKLKVFRRNGKLAWVQLSAWDTQQDAHEYTIAMGRVLAKQRPDFRRRTTSSALPSTHWTHPQQDRVMTIHQQTNHVLIVNNLESALAVRIDRLAWSTSQP
ncbi:MAG: hypothetical protein O7G88_21585 [bacterium]|nr:hypothetical protein [bacterium]